MQTALSVSQMTTYRWSFEEDVAGLHRAGIRRMAVWRKKLEEYGVERAAELLADHEVSVSSLNWGGGFTGACGFTFAEAVEDTRLAIYEAVALGAHALTVVSGGRAGHIHSHYRRLLLDGLAATIDIAAEHGLTIALQPMAPLYAGRWTFLDSLDETLDVVAGFHHPFLGIAFGTYHLWREPRLRERLREAAPYLASVQLADWRPPKSDCDQFVPGDGVIPLPEIIETLKAAGYQGDYEVDVWSADLWKGESTVSLGRCVSAGAALISHPVVPEMQ